MTLLTKVVSRDLQTLLAAGPSPPLLGLRIPGQPPPGTPPAAVRHLKRRLQCLGQWLSEVRLAEVASADSTVIDVVILEAISGPLRGRV